MNVTYIRHSAANAIAKANEFKNIPGVSISIADPVDQSGYRVSSTICWSAGRSSKRGGMAGAAP
ncbi:hypothetical protein [Bradyrhizobium sp.]|jgi:hypothetical protein|uniref:hypothetical protein n=1 Tax=Bradyrhizobium sp. TaxID=376 RepID=UPI003C148CF0